MYLPKKKKKSYLMQQQMLPGDIIMVILSRVPVKSLKRFSCGCKSWHALLTNPNFIKLQLKPNASKILVSRQNHETNFTLLSLHNSETIDASVDMSLPSPLSSYSLSIVGSCNGSLCVSQDPDYRVLFLWNPATRQVRSLPEPQIGPVHIIVGFAFGSDPVTGDYKLVRFVWHGDLRFFDLRNEVYTLSTDCWREKKSDMVTVIPVDSSRTFLNGFLYWIGIDVLTNRKCIVSFNVGAESFREIVMPDYSDDSGMELTVFKDSHALFVYSTRKRLKKCFDLWVMNDDEFGVSNSWSKQFTIGPFSRVAKPLGLLNNIGEVIFRYEDNLNNGGELFLYNPNIKEIKDFPSRGAGRLACEVHYYVESLVSVKGGNEVAAQVSP